MVFPRQDHVDQVTLSPTTKRHEESYNKQLGSSRNKDKYKNYL